MKILKKEIKISKFFLVKSFVKIGIISFVAGLYINQVNKQIELNDLPQNVSFQQNPLVTPFLDLLHKAEGFSQKFYPDNKGVAIGYGYNPTQNNSKYNMEILTYAGVDEETKQTIIEHSPKLKTGNTIKKIPTELKEIKLTSEQLKKMALYAQQSYERDFYSVLKSKLENKNLTQEQKDLAIKNYTSLPETQKAVLTHMSYKVGKTNLAKYATFFNHLISYLIDPTKENKITVADSFNYSYVKDGKKLNDSRVSNMHKSLFLYEAPITVVKKDPVNHEKTESEKVSTAIEQTNAKLTLIHFLDYFQRHFGMSKQEKFAVQKQQRASAQKVTTEEEQENETEVEYEYVDSDDETSVSEVKPKTKI